MKIRLEDIPDYGMEIELPNKSLGPLYTDTDFCPDNDVFVDPNVSGKLFITRDDDEIILSGVVSALARLKCSRCLASYETDLNTEISLVLKVLSPSSLEEEAELEDNEIPIRGTEIDLGAILLQEIVLDVPMKPLCDEKCPGLCPTCGNVRGSDQCHCESADEIDPRWSGLSKIKDRIIS